MSVVKDDHKFEVPGKKILHPEDIEKWEKSEAYEEYLGFVISVSEVIKGRKVRDTYHKSPPILLIEEMLDTLTKWAREINPVEMKQRYGNPAFRTWNNKLLINASQLVTKVVGQKLKKAVDEIEHYLRDSFGNSTRLDYGTGHEMAFVMFLCSLFRIGCLTSSDKSAIGLSVFAKYLDLCRFIQNRYSLEPAGSHGVWALDDYQFVPFIWGAAQLIDHPNIKPKHIPEYDKAKTLTPDYHFFSCVNYISKTKTGPFAEHSNQLWNISGVHHWSKVHSGLIKMYRAEVLCKFPVVQHTLFGTLFSLRPAKGKVLSSIKTTYPVSHQGLPSATNFAMPKFVPERLSNPTIRAPWATTTMPQNPLLNVDVTDISKPSVIMEPCPAEGKETSQE